MHPLGSHLHALRALPPLRLPHVRDRGEVRAATLGHSSSSCYSCNTWWTAAIAIDPSPTADAARLTLPLRTSPPAARRGPKNSRSEEHTSELQSRLHLVCRLLLEKKKNMSFKGNAYYET